MIHMYSDVGLVVITVIHEFDLNKISAICLLFSFIVGVTFKSKVCVANFKPI